MKLLLTIALVVISPALSAAQRSNPQTLTRAQIKEAEQRLADMGYWTGPIDGTFDAGTRSALIAFQKSEGRAISGQLTIEESQAIRTSHAPAVRETGYQHVEVDLDRQVLLLVKDDGNVRVLPVSTGNNKTFRDEGQESVAYTPRGRFLVYAKEVGWQRGSLGSTFYANFISGGVAIHGSRNVPNEPASHGCIRIPMFAAREVSKLMPVGTIVLVYDKVSFVSAKDWVKNPKLKDTALLSAALTDYVGHTDETKAKSGYVVNKKARSRIIRA